MLKTNTCAIRVLAHHFQVLENFKSMGAVLCRVADQREYKEYNPYIPSGQTLLNMVEGILLVFRIAGRQRAYKGGGKRHTKR